MLFFAVFISIIFILINVLMLVTNKKVTINEYKLLSILALLSFSYLAYKIIPPTSEWDLWHHFDEINRMRIGGIDYALNMSRYKDLPVISILFWIVSMTPNNGYITFIAVFIDFSIYLYILFDILKNNSQIKGMFIGVSFFIYISLLNIPLILSGIRNVMAFCIAGLAIYLVFTNKSWKITIVLLIASIFIHPTAIVFIILYILLLSTPLWLGIVLVVIGTNFSIVSSLYFINSNIPIFKLIGTLTNTYETYRTHINIKLLTFNFILVLAYLIYLFIIYKKDKRNKIIKYQILYSVLVVSSISTPIVFNRLLYGLAIIILPSLVNLFSNKSYFVRYTTLILCTIYSGGMLAIQVIGLIRAFH